MLTNCDNKDIISTFSYISHERLLIEVINDQDNLLEDENLKFSDLLLSKMKDNLFWKVARSFDQCVTQEFGSEIRRIFCLTYKSANKKVSVCCFEFTPRN